MLKELKNLEVLWLQEGFESSPLGVLFSRKAHSKDKSSISG